MKAIIKKSDAKEPYTFSFVDEDGKMVVKSENYAAKKSASNGVESVRKNSGDDKRYELKDAKNGKFFFNLKAGNGQVVATSTMYASEGDRAAAIDMLKKEAAGAPLDDQAG